MYLNATSKTLSPKQHSCKYLQYMQYINEKNYIKIFLILKHPPLHQTLPLDYITLRRLREHEVMSEKTLKVPLNVNAFIAPLISRSREAQQYQPAAKTLLGIIFLYHTLEVQDIILKKVFNRLQKWASIFTRDPKLSLYKEKHQWIFVLCACFKKVGIVWKKEIKLCLMASPAGGATE